MARRAILRTFLAAVVTMGTLTSVAVHLLHGQADLAGHLAVTRTQERPNILFILADDLGYDDVPWNNPYVVAPSLQGLASEGVVLTSHYVQSVCSPSRAALLTGYYPIRYGMQHDALRTQEAPLGLPTKYKLMPQYLKPLGYTSYMVGKWHLGHCHRDYLPNSRGFSAYRGFLTANQDYWTHRSPLKWKCFSGGHLHQYGQYDFWKDYSLDYTANGSYSTELYSHHAKKLLQDHQAKEGDSPFFLYLSLQSIHTPIQCPTHAEKQFGWVKGINRSRVLGMIALMDLAIGDVLQELSRLGMRERTIVIFTSDNGPEKHGSAYPLRGGKRTIWEGGHRTPAVVQAPSLIKWKGTWDGLFHVTDWLPTLYHAAGGGALSAQTDGIDQWWSLSMNEPAARTEMLYNLNPVFVFQRPVNGAIRRADVKLIVGLGSISELGERHRVPMERLTMHKGIGKEHNQKGTYQYFDFRGNQILMFNLTTDPEERHNIAEENQDLAGVLLSRLVTYAKSMELRVIGVPHRTNHTQCHGEHHSASLETDWCQPIVDLASSDVRQVRAMDMLFSLKKRGENSVSPTIPDPTQPGSRHARSTKSL